MMPSLPQPVAAAVRDRWPATASTWISQVPDELVQLCQRYRAEVVRVLPARYSFVVEIDANGTRLVLRSTPDPQARFPTATVRALADLEVGPRIYEAVETATSFWTVSERITPGISLFETEAPTSALARVLTAMRGHSPPATEMPSLTDWLRGRLMSDDLSDLPPGQEQAPKEQRQRAHSVLDDLNQTSAPELCHGDASPGNFLTSTEHGLLLVDPRGVCGEVAYDVAVAAKKTAPSGEVARHVSHLARLVGVDPDRATAWVKIAEAARV